MTATLEAYGLGLRYGEREALRDVRLALAAGEAVAIVGPNGAGKSTLLRCLAGVARPTTGAVRYEGRTLAEWPRRELARRIAVVPQVAELFFPFTVREIASLGRTPWLGTFGRSGPRDEAAVDAALAACDLTSLAEARLDRVSGGERQRALIAMAMAQEPRVLLLDEPTAHLDPAHQRATLAFARSAALDRGLLVVAVLHDLNLASVFATRVIVLDAGRVVRDAADIDEATVRGVFGRGLRVIDTDRGRWIAHEPL